jgi:hypothetical protein
MKEIPLTQGYVAQVDDHRYDAAMRFPWHTKIYRRKDGTIGGIYAARTVRDSHGQWTQLLHRFLMGIDTRLVNVDHEDGNGLNCVDDNIRVATKSQNGANRGAQRNNRSGFKGVTWRPRLAKWVASIRVHGEKLYLGIFPPTEDGKIAAARAYDDAAREYFGEFAVTNFNMRGN